VEKNAILVGIISIMGIYWIIDVENFPSMIVENY
jgi:hypothetical protein